MLVSDAASSLKLLNILLRASYLPDIFDLRHWIRGVFLIFQIERDQVIVTPQCALESPLSRRCRLVPSFCQAQLSYVCRAVVPTTAYMPVRLLPAAANRGQRWFVPSVVRVVLKRLRPRVRALARAVVTSGARRRGLHLRIQPHARDRSRRR